MNDVNVSALDRETKLFATIDRLKAENARLRAELAKQKAIMSKYADISRIHPDTPLGEIEELAELCGGDLKLHFVVAAQNARKVQE